MPALGLIGGRKDRQGRPGELRLEDRRQRTEGRWRGTAIVGWILNPRAKAPVTANHAKDAKKTPNVGWVGLPNAVFRVWGPRLPHRDLLSATEDIKDQVAERNVIPAQAGKRKNAKEEAA